MRVCSILLSSLRSLFSVNKREFASERSQNHAQHALHVHEVGSVTVVVSLWRSSDAPMQRKWHDLLQSPQAIFFWLWATFFLHAGHGSHTSPIAVVKVRWNLSIRYSDAMTQTSDLCDSWDLNRTSLIKHGMSLVSLRVHQSTNFHPNELKTLAVKILCLLTKPGRKIGRSLLGIPNWAPASHLP